MGMGISFILIGFQKRTHSISIEKLSLVVIANSRPKVNKLPFYLGTTSSFLSTAYS